MRERSAPARRSGSPATATSSRAPCSTASTSSSPSLASAARSSPPGRRSRRRLCGRGSRRRASASRPGRPSVSRRPTSCCAAPRTACTSRAAASPGWVASPARSLRSAAASGCEPSMWRKRSPTVPRTSSGVSELALAVFCSQTGTHLVEPPRDGRWRAFLDGFDERAYLAGLAALGYRFLPRSDPAFPPLLRAIHDPPPGLFLRGRGEPELLRRVAVAVVGARACSGYGSSVAHGLARELAAAVLGCGIDRDYPAAHAELAGRIAAGGLLVSEYAPGVEPAPWRFPARNRLIAGLCAATVVVEARERSGALITADLALEEGRDVFEVPGEITSSLSAGTNGLLKLGAAPLTGAADVLAALGLEPTPTRGEAPPLLGLLPATADELVRRTGLGADEIARALVELELAGLVAASDGLYRPLGV